jgi:SAM-dependent methyltransferase
MGLIRFASIQSLLVCPRCRAALLRSHDGFKCTASACALNVPDAFPLRGGLAVLVDFDASILRREEITEGGRATARVARRWSLERLPARVRPWLKPFNAVAARNIDLLLSHLDPPATVLVVGGASMGNGVERLYSDETVRTIAFDIHGSALTQFVADAHQIPLADASVDAVVVQAVLEHVIDPERVVAEILRVLREDGLVYAETPFLQQVHAGPYDFVRFTSSGHRYLFRSFEELAAGPVAGPGTQLLWSVDHLVRGLLRSELAGKVARGLLFPLRYLDRAVPEPYAMDNASAYYFLGRRADSELTPEEILRYYRGAQRAPAGTATSRVE